MFHLFLKEKPAFYFLNSRIHIEDKDFALDEGLLPKNISSGKIGYQFTRLAEMADIPEVTYLNIMKQMLSNTENVGNLIENSFLDLPTKRNYLQNYQAKLKQLSKN